MSFSVGEVVMHLSAGMCHIDDLREQNLSGQNKIYYVLRPVTDPRSTILLPTDVAETKIRRPIAKEEALEILRTASGEEVPWIEKATVRKSAYTELLRSGNPRSLATLVARLHQQRKQILQAGRKFSVSDERILKEAEKRMVQELSYTFSIASEEVPSFVLQYRQETI